MKHLCQGDGAQLRMLDGPSQVVIPQLIEQDKASLTTMCKRSYKVPRSLRIGVGVLLIWIEIDEILSRQKSADSNRKNLEFRVK